MAHEHIVSDGDKHFSIDIATRDIVNESGKLVLVQGDHNSERFTFKIPRMVDGHDMSLCDTVQVHYTNIDSATKTEADDVYETSDLKVNPDNEEEVIFSWLISSNATQYIGKLVFSITYLCVDDEGKTEYSWSTGEHDAITVKSRRNNSEAVVAEYSDVLEKWRQELVLANVVEQYTPEQARKELGAASEEYVDGKHFSYSVDLEATGWYSVGSIYQKDVYITGLLSTDTVFVDLFLSNGINDASTIEELEDEYSKIYGVYTGDGVIFVRAKEVPTVKLTFMLRVVR